MYHTMLFALLLPLVAHGLIGYDCGSRQLNVTTLSLADVGECDIPDNAFNVTKTYVQLLQLNDFLETNVIQCRVHVKRDIIRCGMWSHNMKVGDGQTSYIREISRKQCEDLHRTGSYVLPNGHAINDIRVNRTANFDVLLAGSLERNGDCKGVGYSDPFGTWENVFVQGSITIELKEYTAQVKVDRNVIHLRSGTSCTFSDEECLEDEGYAFWKVVPTDTCGFHQYSVLYEGNAEKMIDYSGPNSEQIYSLATQDVTFALAAKGKEGVCGYVLTRTEHPKLLIFETSKNEVFTTKNKISVSNLDIFAYVNSKFIYVERHIRTQMKALYRDILMQKCMLERQTLKNALSLATQAPDDFAYDLMKGPGYMAVIAGEVVHVIKCVPVEVKVEHGDECYAELQVSRNNQTYFLTPRTHVLKSKGTKTACNSLLPAYYSVNGVWYKILPRPTETLAPLMMSPLTKPTWTYVKPAELATSGIYTEKDLDQLRERIMFPVEKSSLLNDLAREMRGHPVTDKDGTIMKLLNEEALEHIMDSTWNKLWTRFMTFGTFSAGVLAILLILNITKTVVDILIKGYALHSVYGCSVHILGAIWSSIAYVLLHRRNHSADKFNTGGIELMETKDEPPETEGKPTPVTRQPATSSENKTFLSMNTTSL